mmetsp:Transcript_17609/g.21361  ORF Transcript_17609/g.21361 Transcript_17609/m.21361 type:complete len:213 (+) Transcript_17609:1587-2225(+)
MCAYVKKVALDSSPCRRRFVTRESRSLLSRYFLSRCFSTAIFSHNDCITHNDQIMHPECAQRMIESISALKSCRELDGKVTFHQAPIVEDEAILRVHPLSHLQYLEALVEKAKVGNTTQSIDDDTSVTKGSMTAARRAAGGVVSAVDKVCQKEAKNAFCCIRPPGHHANALTSMGFCLFNNVVIGAKHARKKFGINKVAILDWYVFSLRHSI